MWATGWDVTLSIEQTGLIGNMNAHWLAHRRDTAPPKGDIYSWLATLQLNLCFNEWKGFNLNYKNLCVLHFGWNKSAIIASLGTRISLWTKSCPLHTSTTCLTFCGICFCHSVPCPANETWSETRPQASPRFFIVKTPDGRDITTATVAGKYNVHASSANEAPSACTSPAKPLLSNHF